MVGTVKYGIFYSDTLSGRKAVSQDSMGKGLEYEYALV